MTRGQVGSRLSVWTVNLRGLELESTNKMNSVGANITRDLLAAFPSVILAAFALKEPTRPKVEPAVTCPAVMWLRWSSSGKSIQAFATLLCNFVEFLFF